MKRLNMIAIVLLMASAAAAQEADSTTGTSMSSGGVDLIRELWLVDDARVIETGRVDLRMTFGWETANFPANLGDSDDDFILTPSIVWGPCNNVEVFAEVPVWLGDGGDAGALSEGNADTNVGFTWRMAEGVEGLGDVAFRGTLRLPTGDNSNGVDAEARLILTHEYGSGIRSHINAFATSVNTDNDKSVRAFDDVDDIDFGDFFGSRATADLRHFQWGIVIGMDGPLCADGTVRWVLDYMNRSSFHYGAGNLNMLEAGWEWTVDNSQKLGMSFQIGLDDNDDTPNFGAIVSYAHALTF